jgi:hypothetical protein
LEIEVLDDPGAVTEHETRVMARHALVGENYVTRRVPPDHQIALAMRPIEREHERPRRLVDFPGSPAPAGRHSCRYERRGAALLDPTAKREVADDAVRINKPLVEESAQTVSQRLLAQQPVSKRGLENASKTVAQRPCPDHVASVSHRRTEVHSALHQRSIHRAADRRLTAVRARRSRRDT